MRSGACALFSLLCACAEPTRIVVVCDTDLEPGVEITAIVVSASSTSSFADSHRFELSETELPFSLAIVPAQRDDEAVRIHATALSGDATVVRFTADTRFVPHQSRVLEIPLARACRLEPACEDREGELTCLRGECVTTEIDPESLPRDDGAIEPLFDGPRVAPDAGLPPPIDCIEGAACDTGNPCEIGAMRCDGEPRCAIIDHLLPGTSCDISGRRCDAEGHCGP